ncbi:MAG: hypothetical protein Q7S31_03765 [bacterium]|nr:hypothetical protein [bacterium]
MIDPKALNLLANEKVSVLVIELSDGPHGAAMHFAYDPQGGDIYFSTHNSTKKVTAVFPAKAALVVGFSETDWETLQMKGMLDKIEGNPAKEKIIAKYPGDAKHFSDESVFLRFTPTWWRYTDFKTHPSTVMESQ